MLSHPISTLQEKALALPAPLGTSVHEKQTITQRHRKALKEPGYEEPPQDFSVGMGGLGTLS